MKHIFTYFKKASLFLAAFVITSFIVSSCSKESVTIPANNGNGSGTTGGANTNPSGTINIVNNAPSTVTVYVNGTVLGSMPAHGSATISGKPGDAVDIIALTNAKDYYGNPVGEPVTLQYSTAYPEDKSSIQQELNVPSNYFYVNIVNLTDGPADQVIVNDPTSGDVTTDVTILNNYKGNTAGYYQTTEYLANIKVLRNKGNAYEWDFDNIKIAGVPNQTISITCY